MGPDKVGRHMFYAYFGLYRFAYIPGIKGLILVPTRFERLGLLHQEVRFNSLVPNIYIPGRKDLKDPGVADHPISGSEKRSLDVHIR